MLGANVTIPDSSLKRAHEPSGVLGGDFPSFGQNKIVQIVVNESVSVEVDKLFLVG